MPCTWHVGCGGRHSTHPRRAVAPVSLLPPRLCWEGGGGRDRRAATRTRVPASCGALVARRARGRSEGERVCARVRASSPSGLSARRGPARKLHAAASMHAATLGARRAAVAARAQAGRGGSPRVRPLRAVAAAAGKTPTAGDTDGARTFAEAERMPVPKNFRVKIETAKCVLRARRLPASAPDARARH